jgi:anthranilate/para-aminobenzoate synthase component I
LNIIYSYFYLPKLKKFLYFNNPSSAYLYYYDFRINLLTGQKEQYPIQRFLERISDFYSSPSLVEPKVIHCFYELGYLFNNLEHLVNHASPLVIAIEYFQGKVVDHIHGESEDIPLLTESTEFPIFEKYKAKFDKVYQHLLDGDCYQLNLTHPFIFKLNETCKPEHFLHRIWQDHTHIGAYAHCSYVGPLNKLFLSNSPECLFQLIEKEGQSHIYSMPIKGTMERSESRDWKFYWHQLKKSKKDEGELNMITDLVRNDLTRIEKQPAKVIARKLPLLVPNIIHQYSLVGVDLSSHVNTMSILSALFPGGSITGAPKKRVMEIIKKIEGGERGFYCGSTLVSFGNLKAASINIRSSEIDFDSRELRYFSGGGVTLRSTAKSEFDESYIKMESFIRLLNKQTK